MTFLEHLLEWTRIRIRSYEQKKPSSRNNIWCHEITFVPTNKNSFQRNKILFYEKKKSSPRNNIRSHEIRFVPPSENSFQQNKKRHRFQEITILPKK